MEDFTKITETYRAFFDPNVLKEELDEILFVAKMRMCYLKVPFLSM